MAHRSVRNLPASAGLAMVALELPAATRMAAVSRVAARGNRGVPMVERKFAHTPRSGCFARPLLDCGVIRKPGSKSAAGASGIIPLPRLFVGPGCRGVCTMITYDITQNTRG